MHGKKDISPAAPTTLPRRPHEKCPAQNLATRGKTHVSRDRAYVAAFTHRMFGLWCILLRKKHRRGWHSLRVGVVGICFVWVSHGKKREFCRACLAKEVRRDSQLGVAREKSWNLACMFDKRSRKGLGFVCLQDQQNGCLTRNRS